MHALDHRAVLRGHQPRGLRAGDAERVDGLVDVEPEPARGARRGGKDAERRARMPALRDVLGSHAQADARSDLVAGDGGRQELLAAHAGLHLRDRDQRGQHDRADVQHARAVHVVELEALDLRAVDERGVRRGELQVRAPHRAAACRVDRAERLLEDARPLEIGAVERAAERVEHQELDARCALLRDRFVLESRNELRDAAGVGIVAAGVVRHALLLLSRLSTAWPAPVPAILPNTAPDTSPVPLG